MTTRRRRGPREIAQYRHGNDGKPRQAPGPGETAGQLAHLKAHREFQRQDRSDGMRVDWCTVISRRESSGFIQSEIHRKINTKCPGFLATGRLTGHTAQTDILRFRRHLQARAVIHPQDGATLPDRLRRRMAAAHHPRVDEDGLNLILHGTHQPPPAWLGAPPEKREAIESARATRHAVRCQGATHRQGETARLGLVMSCRLCGGHWTAEEAAEGCPVCREILICPGDLREWIAAVGPDGRPVGTRTTPRDHGNCAEWHPVPGAESHDITH